MSMLHIAGVTMVRPWRYCRFEVLPPGPLAKHMAVADLALCAGGVTSLEYCDGTLFGGTATQLSGEGDGGRLITLDKDTGEYAFVGSNAATDSGFGPSLGGLAGVAGCTD